MANKGKLEGPRLPYVVRKLEGKVKVTKYTYDRKLGRISPYEAEEDAGYLVMFPAGHYLRIRNAEDLARYRLNKKPRPMAADGMALHPSQSPAQSYENMEADVANYVKAVAGPIAVPNFDGKISLPKRVEEDSYA